MNTPALNTAFIFDARGIAKRFRHAAIFAALESLDRGETMRFVNDQPLAPLLHAAHFTSPSVDVARAVDDACMMGFKIGLHSAGMHVRRFERVLSQLDWVGFDVKAPFAAYEQITRVRGSAAPARRSLDALLASGVDYECRTTAHPALLSEEALLQLASARCIDEISAIFPRFTVRRA